MRLTKRTEPVPGDTMNTISKRRAFELAAIMASVVLLTPCDALAEGCGLPNSKPEAVGFSAQRLQKLEAAMQVAVDRKILPGTVIAVARHGKVVDCKAYGQQDIEKNKPLRVDSIFRIFSMTKPIIGAAMMILYEEGKWQPWDPVEKYIPELAKLKVFAGLDSGGNMILEDAKHPPTIGELMAHTAGFTYGFFGDTPVDKLYKQANPLAGSATLKEFAEKLGKLPLLYQPGEQWVYSVSTDVQALLVERLSGKPLPEFLRDRIFEPLGMKDTAYYVPEQKLSRLVTYYTADASGSMKPEPTEPEVTKEPTLTPGGHGLFSTAADYVRFCQMLLNGGELNGVRILAPSTVQFMRANHLPDRLLTGQFHIGATYMLPGQGFGYDGAVDFDPVKVGYTVGKDTFFWFGLAGTWFWIDPTNDVVFVGLTQRLIFVPGVYGVNQVARALTYQALVRP